MGEHVDSGAEFGDTRRASNLMNSAVRSPYNRGTASDSPASTKRAGVLVRGGASAQPAG